MPFPDWLNALLGTKAPPQSSAAMASVSVQPALLPDSPDEPAQITSPKVLLVIYNPTVDPVGGKKLVTYMGWARPDDLVGRFIADVLQASSGLVRYQIAQRLELDEFPGLADGFRYTAESYLNVTHGGAPHAPWGIDYQRILRQYNVPQRVDTGEFDEVWIMGFPYAGLYESVMTGPGAFWCNAPPLVTTDIGRRRFVIMGFSYERDVGEMLHSYNHRTEAILAKVFNSLDFLEWTYKPNRAPATVSPDQALNFFQRFLLFDQIAPGRGSIGSVHYAPNAVKPYDLGNPNLVQSDCHDWLNFPDFRGDIRLVSAAEWGGGGEREFQRWWLMHLPKTAGRKNGIHNNWWQYIANPDNVVT